VFDCPQLPADFYSAHPVLTHIRRAAHATPVGADAALGACLARVAALVPVGTTLPGVGGTMNFVVGIVGGSGEGKSTAHGLARFLIPDLGERTLDSVPVGSGEGMVEAYLHLMSEKLEGRGTVQEKIRLYDSAYFYVDEIEALLNRSNKENSTTMATIRSMWSGTDVGAKNAKVETSRHLAHGEYRFSLFVGAQPTYATKLLHKDKDGTPQRFLWVSTIDRTIPDVSESHPGPLTIRPPAPGEVRVERQVHDFIENRRRRAIRRELQRDPIESHRDFLQLRTAYLLSVLCGDPAGVTGEWWTVAGQVVETSKGIVHALRDEEKREAQDELVTKVEERIESDEIRQDRLLARLGANLLRYATEQGQPVTYPTIRRQLSGPDRTTLKRAYEGDQEAEVAEFVRRGYLRRTDDGYYLPA
jgi:hypothetical protein